MRLPVSFRSSVFCFIVRAQFAVFACWFICPWLVRRLTAEESVWFPQTLRQNVGERKELSLFCLMSLFFHSELWVKLCFCFCFVLFYSGGPIPSLNGQIRKKKGTERDESRNHTHTPSSKILTQRVQWTVIQPLTRVSVNSVSP